MNPSELLFAGWLLVLPFYQVSIIGPFSLDNLTAPVLGIIGVLARTVSPRSSRGGRGPWWIIVLCGLYMMVNVMGTVVAGNLEQFLSALRLELRVVLYFLLPILFIRNIDQFRRCLVVLTFGSVLVSLSAIAAGLGWIHVGFDTPETRFDVGVERSLGLAGGSGPFAIWSLIALLTAMTADKWGTKTVMRHVVVRWGVYAVLAAGVLAAQSRNVILVLAMAIALMPFVRWLGKRDSRTIVRMTLILAPLVVVMLVVAPLLLGYLYEAFAILGGEGTIVGRLEHYQIAWDLFTQHPFGLSGTVRAKYEGLIDGTHSIWLGVLLMGGLPGLVVLLAIFARAIIGPWNKLRRGAYPTEAAAMVVAAIVMPVSGSFFVAHHNLIFWAFMGLPFAFQALGELPEKSSHTAQAPRPSRDVPRLAGAPRVGSYRTEQ